MSFAAAHERKDVRRTCHRCRDRKARFAYRGRVRADRNHTLCFECFRSERERQRAVRLAQTPHAGQPSTQGEAEPPCGAQATWVMPAHARHFGARPLSERQIAHRRAMLASLQARRAAADK